MLSLTIMTAKFENNSKLCSEWAEILMELKMVHISGSQN